jgi:hypothetical protein
MTLGEFERAVQAAMQKAGYPLELDRAYVNIVYIEGMDTDFNKNDNRPNEFNDLRCVLIGRAGALSLAGRWEATTEPSKYWTDHPMNPGGAARIAFGQQKCWQVGYHHQDENHEALVQTGGPVRVYRDQNKDASREGDKVDVGEFGINQHHGYDLPHGDLGKSSAGCLVGRMRKGHHEFMDTVKSDPRYREDKKFVFTTTVMPALLIVNESVDKSPSPVVLPKGDLISADAEALIIASEVGDIDHPDIRLSHTQYDARYRRPEWPGGGSGVTIGIGYDVGAEPESFKKFQEDWNGQMPLDMQMALQSSIGVVGEEARQLSRALQHAVNVPWENAIFVFEHVTIPKWYALCKSKLPHFEELSPSSRGALVSLAYNRGATFDRAGMRYDEMRRIKQYMADKEYDRIPQQFRAMKRLWSNGLVARREAEAKLFEHGLVPNVA